MNSWNVWWTHKWNEDESGSSIISMFNILIRGFVLFWMDNDGYELVVFQKLPD